MFRLRQVRGRPGQRVERYWRVCILPPQLAGKFEGDESAQAVSVQDVRPVEIRLEFPSQVFRYRTNLSERRFAKAIFSTRQLNWTDVETRRQKIFP